MTSFVPLARHVPALAVHGTFRTDCVQGGYRHFPILQLAMAWWLFRHHRLNARQLRIYFALHEMHERRRGLTSRQKPSYGPEELRRLIGARRDKSLTESLLRADLAHLDRLGLAKWGECSLQFATSPDQLAVDDLSDFWAFFGQLPTRRRALPMPRRLLRALAGGFSLAVTATILALLMRCLYRRGGEDAPYRLDGRAKASWIADVFGVSLRAVKEARSTLIRLGWIEELPVNQRELNRWGGRYRIDPDWTFGSRPATAAEAAGAVDNPPLSDVHSAPPPVADSPSICTPNKEEHSSFFEELLNKTPAFRRPSGAWQEEGRRESLPKGAASPQSVKATARQPLAERAGGASPPVSGPPASREPRIPNLRALVVEDLMIFNCLLGLYYQACHRGLAGPGEHGRLQFFALAERAKAHGRDACRLFSWLLSRQRFDLIADCDEQRAHAWIKQQFYGVGGRPRREERAWDG